MLKEFKQFALKGNVVDLAVGVIIGGAFGKIVTSLVNDMIMPLVSILLGGMSFADLKIVITPAQGELAEVAFDPFRNSLMAISNPFLVMPISLSILETSEFTSNRESHKCSMVTNSST